MELLWFPLLFQDVPMNLGYRDLKDPVTLEFSEYIYLTWLKL